MDQDGDLDLILASRERIFFHENKDGRLAESTALKGLEEAGGAWDVCAGDYDSDGDLDLYVIRSGHLGEGHNVLFRNDLGSQVFLDVTQPSIKKLG